MEIEEMLKKLGKNGKTITIKSSYYGYKAILGKHEFTAYGTTKAAAIENLYEMAVRNVGKCEET